MKTSELIKRLKKSGCFKIREGRSHEIWESPITDKEFQVGRHSKEIPKGTIEKIMKAAGLI